MSSTAFFKSLIVALAVSLCLPYPVRIALAQAPTGLRLSVVPLGKGIVATSKTERQFAVQIQDVSTGPIVGAEVVFSVPAEAAGSFENGSKRASVFSNLRGIAITPTFRISNDAPIDVQVQASFKNQSATATLFCCSAELSQSKTRRNTILGIVMGAAAGTAIYFSVRGGSSPAPAVIQPGTPTLGLPK
jgi:hypothetical protein